MTKNLVIVESPAKAKTIEKFLGEDYKVTSCFGHIRDLIKGDDAIAIDKGYLPKYEVPADKQKVVKELKKLAGESDLVWLASDEDREGEAISWHLSEVLKLDPSKRKRIVFHEITKPAILQAIDNPRDIDEHLVDAQQARRVLDRLVGFTLSPVLWRKVKPALSAGRVQSVAVRLIVEREREIEEFNTSSAFRVVAHFVIDGKNIQAELNKRFENREEAEAFLKSLNNSEFTVKDIEVKPVSKKPAPPFTTSTLQQEASRKLGYSVSRTMTLAQRLYESGHITYMRTDSVNLSDLALQTAKDEIVSSYGEDYSKTRKYSTKSASAQEAHEAIRPTYFENRQVTSDTAQQRLYELIWKRALASQMSDARLEKTVIKIVNSNTELIFQATGEVLKFEGFLKVYIEGKDDEDDEEAAGLLPTVTKGQRLSLEYMTATERFTRPPARYTEATLVRQLEELGIGRPSTYAPTISTIQKRGYVTKESIEGKERNFSQLTLKNGEVTLKTLTEITGADKNKLIPSDIGKIVTDFLTDHFEQIMDYSFTANVEKEFDEIAKGTKNWSKMIDGFYVPFNKTVISTMDTADRATGERELGTDPKTGKKVIARIGRYGPMVQIGEADEEDKPQFASIVKGQTIDKITLEEALQLFKLPRTLGEFEGKEVKANVGRFGPYVQHNGKYASLEKTDDPHAIDLDRAIELILKKRKSESERVIQTFEQDATLQVLNGRYGPYISHGKKNFKIPKDKEPKTLTYEEVLDIIKNTDKDLTKKKPRKKS